MKRYLKYLAIFGIISFMSCNKEITDNTKGGGIINIIESMPQGTFNSDVTGLQLTPAERKISVEWAPAQSSELSHYYVEYVGKTVDTALYSLIVKKSETKVDLLNLFNDEYTVTVKCVSDSLLYSVGTSKKGSTISDLTGPAVVTNVVLDPLAVSALLTWTNPTDPDFFTIKVELLDDNNEIISSDSTLAKSVHLFYDLTEGTNYKYRITSYDYIGNTSTTFEGSFKTLIEQLVERDAWSLYDFSSQETTETNPATTQKNTGMASHVIDNNPNTFWHTKWRSPASSLPQYLIIDLGTELIPTALISYKRVNTSSSGPRIVKLEGSLTAAEGDWYDFGTTTITDVKSNVGQVCNIINAKRVRYIKYIVQAAGTVDKPVAYAQVSEIELRALQ